MMTTIKPTTRAARDFLAAIADRKTAVIWHRKPSGADVSDIPNAFGLPAAITCSADDGTGMTSACRSICYAARTATTYPAVSPFLARNLELVSGVDRAGKVALLADMVSRFLSQCDKVETKTGRKVSRAFRIHWSGDFGTNAQGLGSDYVDAWRGTLWLATGTIREANDDQGATRSLDEKVTQALAQAGVTNSDGD
jgi:hypothetical protein